MQYLKAFFFNVAFVSQAILEGHKYEFKYAFYVYMFMCVNRYLSRRQFSYAPMDVLPFALSFPPLSFFSFSTASSFAAISPPLCLKIVHHFRKSQPGGGHRDTAVATTLYATVIIGVRLIARITDHIHFVGLRDGWTARRPVGVYGAPGGAGGRRAQGALGDAAPLGQHRRGGGGGGGNGRAGRRARTEPVEAVKRVKAVEAGLARQLFESSSQEPLLARQLLLVYDVLTIAIF